MLRRVLFSAAALAVAALTGSALADGRVTITDATGVYNGSDGSGGAFTVTRATPGTGNQNNGDYNGLYGGNRVDGDGRSANSFLSFCLERQDNLGFGSTYFSQIETSAYDTTAPTGQPNPDELSWITANIYREFRRLTDSVTATVDTTGFFGGAFGASLSGAETTAIQQAIWYTEGELAWASLSTAAQDVYTWASGAGMNQGLRGVRVLRLWSNFSTANSSLPYQGQYRDSHQDLLTLVPLPPAAYAGIGTFAGIFALAAVRRRKLAAE
jgi:hypothetical protein